MRVRHKVNLKAFVDSTQKDALFSLDDAASEVVTDGFAEQNSGISVLPATTPFTIPFGSVNDVRGIFLKSTGDYTVSFNGGTPLLVRRAVTGTGFAPSNKVLLEATLTSVVVVPAAPMTLSYAVWGDPIA